MLKRCYADLGAFFAKSFSYVNLAVAGALCDGNKLIKLYMQRYGIFICACRIKNTIKNVIMVVPVFITNCQEQEKWAYTNPYNHCAYGAEECCGAACKPGYLIAKGIEKICAVFEKAAMEAFIS